MKNIILDLCGGSGAWSEPYKKAGFRVYNITLPDFDVLDVSFFSNVITCLYKSTFLAYKCPIEINLKEVYGIFVAPPCQMFSLARTRAKTPRDLKEGMKVVKACLNIIWEVRYRTKLNFWALENPVGFLRQFLGVPKFTFQPYEFGDEYTKKTDIWGYFNIPKRVLKNDFKLLSISDITNSKQADKRAITPKGFAEAFFKSNSKL